MSNEWTSEQLEEFRQRWDALISKSHGAVVSIVIPDHLNWDALMHNTQSIDVIVVETVRDGKLYRGLIPCVGVAQEAKA